MCPLELPKNCVFIYWLFKVTNMITNKIAQEPEISITEVFPYYVESNQFAMLSYYGAFHQ